MIFRIRPDGTREVVSDTPVPGFAPPAQRGVLDTIAGWLIGAACAALLLVVVAAAGTFALWVWRQLDPPREVQGAIAIIAGLACLTGLVRDGRPRHWS